MQGLSNKEWEMIQAVFSRLRTAPNLLVGLRLVRESIPEARSNGNHIFIGPFDFVIGLSALLKGLQTALDTAQRLRLKSAPRIVDQLDLPSGEAVVVLRYKGCMTPPPPLIGAQYRIPALALRNFIDDMRTLLAADVGHPTFLRGREAWRISEDGNCILLDQWEKLRSFDAQEVSSAQSILQTLGQELSEALNGEESDDNPLLER